MLMIWIEYIYIYMWVCYVFVKNWWRMKLWLLNYKWIHDYLLLMMIWSMLLMNWYNGYSYLWIGDENCCCCWKKYESLVNCWILIKWCFNLKFYASLSVFSCIWPVNIFGTSMGIWKIKIWDFVWKEFETRNVLAELMSVRLS